MICIGGVCLPSTAVVPILLLVARWTLAKLYVWGLVPEPIAVALNLKQIQFKSDDVSKSTSTSTSTVSSSSSSTTSTTTTSRSGVVVVKALESEDEFEELIKSGNKVCMKFTAGTTNQTRNVTRMMTTDMSMEIITVKTMMLLMGCLSDRMDLIWFDFHLVSHFKFEQVFGRDILRSCVNVVLGLTTAFVSTCFVCFTRKGWCTPCKKIHPKYESLAASFVSGGDQKNHDNKNDLSSSFLTVDVDEYDTIASKYGISMMPTFVIVQGDKIVGKMSGSNEAELESFMKKHLP